MIGYGRADDARADDHHSRPVGLMLLLQWNLPPGMMSLQDGFETK
jgi:hypothetical protein